LQRTKRQDVQDGGGHVIDSIFNIPITAIRQTAAAAQSFSPQNSQAIDSVLKIPVSTLEAVGTLVKATSDQRRLNADELQRIRQEKRDRILAQRERQRLQREQQQQQRLQQQHDKRNIKINKKNPFGLNALSVLVSNHGLLGSIQGPFGGHGGHGGTHGGQPGSGGYEVHEQVEEDTNYSWHGVTAGIGTYYGSRPSNTRITIQNKIAPRDEMLNRYPYDDTRIQNKIAPNVRLDYEDDPPLQNKVAPRNNRVTFQS
ncbi:hypothetical protein WN48_00555, partial [Eufriesea mexicana]